MQFHQEDLAFIPLGGTGEIGLNLNVYRCDGKLLAVDCGLGFGGAEQPEAEVMVPDPAWLADRKDKLLGLVITHAHEDHIGAVAPLWPQLRCPIYCSPFTASVLRRKLGEAGLLGQVKLVTIPLGGRFELGPFALQFIRVTHSVPEPQSIAIRTRHGTVLHTGDWKLDPDPLVGEPADEEAFAALGREGVLAMVCDSTNALVEGHSGSEAEVRRNMTALIRQLKGRVAVTCFATNLARVESIALAGKAAGRDVALFGRSLRNAEASARECGYLQQVQPFLHEDDADDVPDDQLLIVCTGSQGEPRSAMAKIAADTHPRISLGEGDTVIFSSRMIPGNERAILRMQDELARGGCKVMTADDHMVHVSGHPARDELKKLYSLVKPRFAVPVHGEWRHLRAHAALGRLTGVPAERIVLAEDGVVVDLVDGKATIVGAVPCGYVYVDGLEVGDVGESTLKDRLILGEEGFISITVAIDSTTGKAAGDMQIAARGFSDDPKAFDPVRALIQAELDTFSREGVTDVHQIAQAVRRVAGRWVSDTYRRRPMIIPVVVEV